MQNLDINEIRKTYIDSTLSWEESTPSEVQQKYAEIIRSSWSQTAYVARSSVRKPGMMEFCPPHSLLNMGPMEQHSADYGTGIFEGSSAEPILDENGGVVGVNVVLLEPRLQRFERSMKARGFTLPVSQELFRQSLLDIVAIHGIGMVTNDDGTPTRGYVRPAAGPSVGKWGISLSQDYLIEAHNFVFRWGPYFPDFDRVYDHEGAKVVINGHKRLFQITGKHASNYGAAAIDGHVARVMNYDELLYLAPYGIKNGEMTYDIQKFSDIQKYGVLADGPGEEVFGILSDGTLVYPPMRVNRLGGTVLQYVVDHICPRLGIETREEDITIEDLRSGRIVGLGYAGNAARITPIGQIDMVEETNNGPEFRETIYDGGIHDGVRKVMDQWEGELRGKITPSHDSLLTPVDLEWGEEYRGSLDDMWSKLGFKPLSVAKF